MTRPGISDELSAEDAYDLQCEETSDRVDIMDEYHTGMRNLFREARRSRAIVFFIDTGRSLPICCKFPKSNLYAALCEHHQSL
jgi:hypothetical protein